MRSIPLTERLGYSNAWTLRQVAEILRGKAEAIDGLHFDPAIPAS